MPADNSAHFCRLRDECFGQDARGGTGGLSVRGQGIVRRHYPGWQIHDTRELTAAAMVAASMLRGQMPSLGWDWTDLQEIALRAQREAHKEGLSAADSEDLFDEFVKQLEDLHIENRLLKDRLSRRPMEGIGTDDGAFSIGNLVRQTGPEIHSAENAKRKPGT